MDNSNSDTQETGVDCPSLELPSQQQLLQRLEHFSIYSDKLIALAGQAGSGKSSLLSLLAQSTPAPIQVIKTNCRNSDWFSSVLSQYGLHSAAGEKSFHFGLGQIEPAQDLLLILDEAEHLTLDQIERLADKVKTDNFHCILALDESSNNLIWLKESSEQVLLLQVEPLSEEESLQLLAHELGVEDHQLSVIVGESKLESFLGECDGTAGHIISFARNLLHVQAQSNFVKPVSTKSIFLSLSYLSIAVLLIFALIYQDSINQFFEPAAQPPLAGPVNTKNTPSELSETNNSPFIEPEVVHEKAPKDLVVETHSDNVTDKEKALTENTLVQTSSDSQQAQLGNVTPAENESNQDNNISELKNSVEIKNGANLDVESLPVVNTEASESVDQNQAVIPDNSPVVSQPVVSEKISSTNNWNDTNIQNNPAEKVDMPYTAEEIQLLQMDGRQWMIQLAGFSVLANAASFMQQHLNDGELHFYRTDREGTDWYVVIMGPYPNKAAAQFKRQSLPEALQSRRPWLKPVSSVQEEIQKPARR